MSSCVLSFPQTIRNQILQEYHKIKKVSSDTGEVPACFSGFAACAHSYSPSVFRLIQTIVKRRTAVNTYTTNWHI